jgi:hypothetical protein
MRGRKIRHADWLAFGATDLRRFHVAKAKRARDRRGISLAVFDPHCIGLHKAACHVLAAAQRTLSVVGRTRRVPSMAGRAVMVRTRLRRSFHNRRAILTNMMHAAAQKRVRDKYQARQQMVKSLHGSQGSCS